MFWPQVMQKMLEFLPSEMKVDLTAELQDKASQGVRESGGFFVGDQQCRRTLQYRGEKENEQGHIEGSGSVCILLLYVACSENVLGEFLAQEKSFKSSWIPPLGSLGLVCGFQIKQSEFEE